MQQSDAVEEIQLTDLLVNPKQYHRAKIRVKGVARIEFEGNSLYSDHDAFASRSPNKAVWLGLGWPVTDDVLALNGRDVVVEGTFDSLSAGHDGAYVGSITPVNRMTPAP